MNSLSTYAENEMALFFVSHWLYLRYITMKNTGRDVPTADAVHEITLFPWRILVLFKLKITFWKYLTNILKYKFNLFFTLTFSSSSFLSFDNFDHADLLYFAQIDLFYFNFKTCCFISILNMLIYFNFKHFYSIKF